MKTPARITLFMLLPFTMMADVVPTTMNYQGRVSVNGASSAFTGDGRFKFAIVDSGGAITRWSNDGTSVAGSAPALWVTIPVNAGSFNVRLGDTLVGGMLALPTGIFENSATLKLRVWFNDGTNGFEQLSPDMPLCSVPYAVVAKTAGGLASGVKIGTSQISSGAIDSSLLASNSITASKILTTGSPVPGQVLSYNGSSLVWNNPAPGGGGDSVFSLNGTSAYYNGGRVGIGTASPSGAFHVASGGVAVTGENSPYTGAGRGVFLEHLTNYGGALFAFDYNTYTPRILALNSPGGKVGIGTLTPDSQLHIHGQQNALGITAYQPVMSLWDSGNSYKRAALQSVDGSLNLFTDNYLTGINPYGYLQINNASGHVGIGTYTPTSPLTIATSKVTGYVSEQSNGTVTVGTYLSSSAGWLGTKTNHKLLFFVNDGGSSMTIDTTGNVGIGTSSPGARLDVQGDVRGTRLVLRADPGAPSNAAILCADANVTNFVPYNTATGRPLGLVVRDASVRQLTITGGADLAEPFAMSHDGIEPGSVVIIDPDHPGKLRMSRQAYDKKVAGIVSGADGIRPGISMIQEDMLEAGENVALSGRVYVKANHSSGAIGPGDLLTTSDIPGEAMKAGDHERAQGAILGKAMTGLRDESGMVLVLVTLQ